MLPSFMHRLFNRHKKTQLPEEIGMPYLHGLDASEKLLFYIRGIFNRCNECQPFYVPHDTYRLAELPPHRRAGADYDYRCG